MKLKRFPALLLVLILIVNLMPANLVQAKSKTTVNLTVGQTKQLKLTNVPKGKTVKWSSNNKKVAQVTQKGKVKAKKAGKAKITAKLGKKKYICIVKVKGKKKENIPETTAEAVPECEIVVEEDTTTETNMITEEATEETTTEEMTTEETTTEETTTEETTTEETTTEETTTEGMTTQDATTEEATTEEPLPEKPVEAPIPSIAYQAHVEDIGWMTAVKDGVTAGTTGKAKRLEGLKIVLKDDKGNSMIKYRAHVEDIGWQGWKTSGQEAGTDHQSKRMEAIQIELTGTYASKYDIYYRAHVANFGWLGWAKNGEMAGSQKISLQMEAIQIKLVQKNVAFAVGGSPVVEAPNLTYQVHCADCGWKSAVSAGVVTGTTGQNRQLEGIKINLSDTNGKSGIEYRAHVEDVGWQGWKNSGELAGTTGQARQIEAIEIKLKGNIANDFDIYYRVHVSDIGWLGWAKNGETAGTTGGRKQAEAIQIQLVAKDAPIDRAGEAYKKLTQETDKAKKVIAVAKSQVGYHEKNSMSNLDDFNANSGSNNYTKYARDTGFGNASPWCAIFVIWCMEQAGVSTNSYGREAYVPNMRDWFAARGLFKLNGTYTPKPGDLVFFWGETTVKHVGIVVDVSGNRITTVEGNSGPGDTQVMMYNNRGGIYGYGIVNY